MGGTQRGIRVFVNYSYIIFIQGGRLNLNRHATICMVKAQLSESSTKTMASPTPKVLFHRNVCHLPVKSSGGVQTVPFGYPEVSGSQMRQPQPKAGPETLNLCLQKDGKLP